MKANELQIDDFIMVDGIVRKVCAITKHKIGYHKLELPFGECQMSYSRLYEVGPIPLTPDILWKNGWVFNNAPFINGWEFMGLTICDWTIFCGINVSMNVRYVHELQRVLRLCGLNDLADNFKI